LTSGMGGRFPEGFPVASITHISPEQSGAFADIRARPMADMHDVRDVVLVSVREPKAMPTELPPSPTLNKLAPWDSPPPEAAGKSEKHTLNAQ